MARTFRNNPSPQDKCLRHPQTKNYLQQMVGVVDELEEYGYTPSNRERKLANKDNHPNLYDDIFISALDEDKSWKEERRWHKKSSQTQEFHTPGYNWPQTPKEASSIGKEMESNKETLSTNLWVYSLPFHLFFALIEELV